MSWRRLQQVFRVTVLHLRRRLEEVLKTSWRHHARHLQEVLGDEKLLPYRRLENILKTCLEDILKTLWRQATYLLEISVYNKSKCASNKSIFHKSIFDDSKENLNPLIATHHFNICLILKFTSISISRIKIFDDWCCEISWIHIWHCRKGEAIKTNF